VKSTKTREISTDAPVNQIINSTIVGILKTKYNKSKPKRRH
jgi:hypothetical protein